MQANKILYGIILNQDYIIGELLDGKLVKNIDEILEYTTKVLSTEVGGNSDLIELVEKQKSIITVLGEAYEVSDIDKFFEYSDIDKFFEYSEDIIKQYDYLCQTIRNSKTKKYTANIKIVLNKEEFDTQIKTDHLLYKLRKEISPYGKSNIPLDKLIKMVEILES